MVRMVYDIRNGEPTAQDTAIGMIQRMATADAGNFKAPAGVDRISLVIVSASADAAAADTVTYTVELNPGSGVQVFLAGASGGETAATSACVSAGEAAYKVNIPVIPGEDIPANAYMQTGDNGTGSVNCTLGYSTGSPGPSWPSTPTKTIARSGTSGTIDATFALATDRTSTSSGSINIPQVPGGKNPTKISEIAVCSAHDGAAAGVVGINVRLSGSPLDPAEHFFGGQTNGGGTTANVSGNSTVSILRDAGIVVTGAGAIMLEAAGRGIDSGDWSVGVALTFQ